MPTDILSSTLTTLSHGLESISYPTLTFVVEDDIFTLFNVSSPNKVINTTELPRQLEISPIQLKDLFKKGKTFFNVTANTETIPRFFNFATQLGFDKIAFLPIVALSKTYGMVVVGSYKGQQLNAEALHPLTSLIQLACKILEQTETINKTEKKIAEAETLISVIEGIKTPWDTTAFFQTIHEQIRREIGNYAFIGALFDEKTASINIPYLYEDGHARSIEAFPIGEGLTSILLRSKQPLFLNENFQEQAESLGAKIDGRPAKSWMGTPMLIEDQAIGALIVQDLENEKAFTREQLDLLSNISNQIAKFIFNARLLDESRNQIDKIQTAAEIARDISSALNLDELLLKAVNLILERFNFYHASIFLIDPSEKNAVIREATGEAGMQLKRMSHKLAVGSKSIVGFVSGQGEPLVVNDITKDATYLPNPMLADTRAEAAIPLKIGDRILGVLDVQSTIPYSFSPNDVNIFQTLADQLAIAVNNTELFAETQEHLSQHRLLHHITTSAASGTTLEEALDSAVEGLQVTLGGDRVAVLLADEECKHLVVKAWIGYSEDASDLIIPFGSGITGWAATHRKTLRINDISQDTRYIQVSSNTRSELALPLIFRNDLLGVLNVESEQTGAYNENDEEMLGTLAGSLAAIIANARLVDQIRKQAERERLLHEISNKIRRSTDMHTILSTTVQELHRVTGAQKAQIKIGFEEPETKQVNVHFQDAEKE
ncbi:MAG: GAF domain-containing protein [Anaerolineales bacterium]|jgi:GAF domain-containing protein